MNVYAKDGNQFEKKKELALEILKLCQNKWNLQLPYINVIFSEMKIVVKDTDINLATDGKNLFFSIDLTLKMYLENADILMKELLHTFLHCIFFHIFPSDEYDKEIWNLSTDLVVEMVMLQMIKKDELGKIIGNISLDDCEELKILGIDLKNNYSAEKLYEQLYQYRKDEILVKLKKRTGLDNHDLWYKNSLLQKKEIRKKWEYIVEDIVRNNNLGNKLRGNKSEYRRENLESLSMKKYDYSKFLKRFAVFGEEMEIDQDNFDYILYNYGMEQYGNIAIIEPLEYKEVSRLDEIAIAIDTSGSCSKEMVQKFLSDTFRILETTENFFAKMKVYLIQCDCCIQDIQVITSKEEWKTISENIVIQGRGGTDFRPVFKYIEKQKSSGEISHLRALIYFTDGDGIYPIEKPDYETAVVFMEKVPAIQLVPSWAIRLVAE